MFHFKNFYLAILPLFFNFHFPLNAQTKSNHLQHDWQQWRGPNRDGISRETGLLKTWPKGGPKVLWTHPWRTDSFENVATPVFFSSDKLFFSSAHPKEAGAAVLQIKAANGKINAETIWKNNIMQHHFASSVFYDGFLYGTDRAILKCIDAGTGREMWKQRGFGEGSLILADGHLLVLGTGGNLALVEATPTSYKEKAGAQVLSGKCFTAPSLANGKLYLRNETEMVCLDLSEANFRQSQLTH